MPTLAELAQAYFDADSGQFRPTKKGILMTLEQYLEMKALLANHNGN